MKNLIHNQKLKYIIIIPVAAVTFITVIFLNIITNTFESFSKNELKSDKEELIKFKKEIIQNQVLQAISLIDHKISLKDSSLAEAKKQLLSRFSKVRFDQKGYLYIVDKNGTVLAHRNEEVIGTDGFLIHDSNNKYYMKDGFNLSKKYGEGFLEYISVTNQDTTWNNKKKLTFVKYYPKFQWSISAGIYIDDIEKVIEEKAINIHKQNKKQSLLIISIGALIAFLVALVSYYLARKFTYDLELINLKLHSQVKTQTAKLKQNLEFMNRLLHITPIPIFVKNEKLEYIKCNQAFCDFLGVSKKEIIGKTAYDLSPEDLAKIYEEQDLKLKIEDVQFYESEVKNPKTSQIRKVQFYKTALKTNGEFSGVLGVIVDITDKYELMKELKNKIFDKTLQNKHQEEQFEQERIKNLKFTAIGQLAAGITHEINTPITYIKGNLEMIGYDVDDLSDCDEKTRIKEDLQKVNDGIKRVELIVESMREISQKSKESQEIVNVYDTLITALNLAHNRSMQISKIYINGHLYHLGMNAHHEYLLSFVQKQRLEQVWIIILNNALDQLIQIDKFENRMIDIAISKDIKNNKIIVSISDNAGGISQEIMENIFDPFTSSKDSGGMGVGLNVAKRIIEEQQGSIEAFNIGSNAVFKVMLPLCSEEGIK